MYPSRSNWLVAVTIITLCCSATADIKERDAPCPDKSFTGSPSNTMFPTKGKELVSKGRTLKQEAAGMPILQTAVQFAEASSRFKGAVTQYGKSMGLDGNETLAIFCYTLDNLKPTLHDDFNGALRNGDDSKYPVYHYFLDSGIKKLAAKQGNPNRQVYRGSKQFFSFPQTQTTFPGFTSTSLKLDEAKAFLGDGCTMFEVKTRYGAHIKEISQFPTEEEVLFPPYEVFSVGDYRKSGGIQMITLQSVGTSGAVGLEMMINVIIVSNAVTLMKTT